MQDPAQYLKTENANYHHLVMDIAWFGVGMPAVMNFFSMFAIKLGATPIELGWMSGLPAIFLLLSTMLNDWWRGRYPDSVRAIFLPAFASRLRYLLYALVPFLPASVQVFSLVLIPTVFAIPIGISGVIFLVLLRESVGDARLTSLVSRRLLFMNAGIAISTIVLGFWLEKAPFPANYQIMYLVSFGAQLVSMWHVNQVRILQPTPPPAPRRATREPSASGSSPWRSGEFRRLALVLTTLFIAGYSIGPVIPLFLVRGLGVSEGFVAVYSLMELAGAVTLSALASRVIHRFGRPRTIVAGLTGTGLAALLLAALPSLPTALIAGLIGGGFWALTDISQFGLFSANTSPENRASYTKAYYQLLSIASFIGPMVGSSLANAGISLALVLLLGAGLRFLAGGVAYRFATQPAQPTVV